MKLLTGNHKLHAAWRRPVTWTVPVVLALCLAAASGCGKKGPPLLPLNEMPPVINNLRITLQGDTVILNWSPPKRVASSHIAGFFVYRYRSSISEKCDTCPKRYEQIARIPYHPDEFPMYRDTVLPGSIYYYKVTCYTPGGTEGKSSNVVSCTVPKKNG